MSYQIPDVSKIDLNKITRNRSNEPDFIPSSTPVEKDFYRQAVFNTGSVWLLGMIFGGIYGAVDGYVSAPGRTIRILSNSILNGISKRGSTLGNRVAVIAMLHTISTAGGSLVFDDYLPTVIPHTPSEYTVPIFAGLFTGSTFLAGFGHKSPRVYLLAASIGAVASCGYWFGGSYVYNAILGARARRKF